MNFYCLYVRRAIIRYVFFSKKKQQPTFGPPAKHHSNGVLLVGQKWLNTVFCQGSKAIFLVSNNTGTCQPAQLLNCYLVRFLYQSKFDRITGGIEGVHDDTNQTRQSDNGCHARQIQPNSPTNRYIITDII